MPILSSFNGIVVKMYFDDAGQHQKPHVHVEYAGKQAVVALDGHVLDGKIPGKQLKAVRKWLRAREQAVYRAWNLAVSNRHFDTIPPV